MDQHALYSADLVEVHKAIVHGLPARLPAHNQHDIWPQSGSRPILLSGTNDNDNIADVGMLAKRVIAVCDYCFIA
jgi:hypothetical protein